MNRKVILMDFLGNIRLEIKYFRREDEFLVSIWDKVGIDFKSCFKVRIKG